jgi:hypothetical protein
MWRKIHSNRDPRDTLFSELKKEFSPKLNSVRAGFLKVLAGYPKFFFGIMIVLMLVSAALSFTVFRHREKTAAAVPAKSRPSPVEDGFSQIMKTTGELQETISLKHTVDSLTSKKLLSRQDSLVLDSALNRLQHIHPLK